MNFRRGLKFSNGWEVFALASEAVLNELLHLLSSDREVVANEFGEWKRGTDLLSDVKALTNLVTAASFAAVGIACGTGPGLLAALLAAIKSGRPQVLFGARWQVSELQAMLGESPCSVFIAEAGQFTDFSASGWELHRTGGYSVWIKQQWEGLCPEGEWLGQFTSGTTGKSRLVIRDWRAIGNEIESLEAANLADKQGSYLTLAPLHHSYGFCGGFIWPLVRGTKVLTVGSFYPSASRKICGTLHPSVIYGVPFQYEFMATAPGQETLPSSALALSAGSPLTREVRELALQRLNIRLSNNYGSTETGTICVYPEMPIELDELTVGYPLPGWSLHTDDQGQLRLSGAGAMRGYYNAPPIPQPYPTGDKGLIFEDGRVQLLGRFRRMINVGGEKVSPEKVESVLKLHPGISEAVVMPRAAPGFYQQVKAFVEPKPGFALTPEEVIRHCKQRLFPVEVPKVIYIMDKLPKSETGKILGKYLEQMS